MSPKIALSFALRSRLAGAALVAAGFFAQSPAAHAVLISSWNVNNGSANSGLATSSPVLGDGSANSANSQQIYASTAASYALSIGDSVTLSGSVTFAGMAAPQADQFRFGLYDVNGKSTASGWLGYFSTNTGTASSGQTYSRLWERDNPNTFSYGSGSGATLASFANASAGTNTAFSTGSYTFSQTIARTSAGLDITWSIIGTSLAYSLSGSFSDTTPQTYAFNRVGFFIGGGLNASQINFSNVDVTFTAAAVPEPAAWATLAAGAALAFASVRRRAVRG